MLPQSFVPNLNARPFNPSPRFAETVKCTLDQILTTEESAARDEANLSAVREWFHNAYMTT